MKTNLKSIYIITSLFIISSCGGGGGGGGAAAVQKLAATISSFTSSIFSTEVGSSVEITWSSSNASSCSASGGWSGTKAVNGSETIEVSSVGDTTYTLTCSGEGGNASRTITIEGYRNIVGIAVDGYISGASIFIDMDEDYSLDSS